VGRNPIGAMPFGYCALRRQQGLRFRPLEKRVGVQKFGSAQCPSVIALYVVNKDCAFARLKNGWVSRNLQLPGCLMGVQEFDGYCALRRQQGLRFRPLEKRVGVQKFAASGMSHGCPGI